MKFEFEDCTFSHVYCAFNVHPSTNLAVKNCGFYNVVNVLNATGDQTAKIPQTKFKNNLLNQAGTVVKDISVNVIGAIIAKSFGN